MNRSMKKIYLIGTVVLAAALSACGASKQAAQPQPQSYINVETKMAVDECITMAEEKPEVRAWGEGISFSMSSASNAAELQARAKFARAIAAKIKTAEENSGLAYGQGSTNYSESSRGRDEAGNYNEYQLSIAEETVKNTVVVKTSPYRMQDGAYHIYVCLEYKDGVSKMAEEITEKVKQQVPDEDRLKMQYEFEKFRERVEEELKKSNAQ